MSAQATFRPATRDDLPLLEAMLDEAFHWDPGQPRRAFEVLRADPEFRKLLAEWGARRGDAGVVAAIGERAVGAAWYRLWTDDTHSYGYVDARTPELAIAVAEHHRGGGIGARLLAELVQTARAEGHPGLCLSVDPQNPARRLYERAGFRKVGESGTSWTLLLRLAAA